MAKLSINAAAKLFDVSRPTILKNLTEGKITGSKGGKGDGWQIDTSELARTYPLRAKGGNPLPANSTTAFMPILDDLRAEVERLKSSLAVAEALADERGKRLDQLVPLLTDQRRRRWWQF
jgi:hypothetical protein